MIEEADKIFVFGVVFFIRQISTFAPFDPKNPICIFSKSDGEMDNKNCKLFDSLQCQIVHWLGERFCFCMFLDSRDKSSIIFQNVSEFRLKYFSDCNVNFFSSFVLPWNPQEEFIASASKYLNTQNESGLRNCKWKTQNF